MKRRRTQPAKGTSSGHGRQIRLSVGFDPKDFSKLRAIAVRDKTSINEVVRTLVRAALAAV